MVMTSGKNLGGQVCPNEGNDGEGDRENLTSEEFEFLDSKLDDLNTALDFIEKKNDDIHAQLLELLHSNREVRKELQKENIDKGAEPETSSTSN